MYTLSHIAKFLRWGLSMTKKSPSQPAKPTQQQLQPTPSNVPPPVQPATQPKRDALEVLNDIQRSLTVVDEDNTLAMKEIISLLGDMKNDIGATRNHISKMATIMQFFTALWILGVAAICILSFLSAGSLSRLWR